MQITVPYSIAVACFRLGNDGVKALRAYTLLHQAGSSAYVTRAELFRVYASFGISERVAKDDLKALLKLRTFGNIITAFAFETQEATPRLIRRSMYKITQDLGMTHKGFLTFEPEDFNRFKAFKLATLEQILFGLNRAEDGGVTFAREGMHKLTGMSEKQLGRAIADMGITVRTNYAQVIVPENERSPRGWIARHFGPRMTTMFGGVIQISNTYYSKRPEIGCLSKNYQMSGVPVHELDVLRPEYGQYSLRQRFPDGVPSYELLTDLLPFVDVDIMLGEAIIEATGQVVGQFIRLVSGVAYKVHELHAVLHLARTIDRPGMSTTVTSLS